VLQQPPAGGLFAEKYIFSVRWKHIKHCYCTWSGVRSAVEQEIKAWDDVKKLTDFSPAVAAAPM